MAKIIPIISIIVVSVVFGLFVLGTSSFDRDTLANNFILDAEYDASDGYITITFDDVTKQTTSITLEILGLDESFQKTYDDYQFTERVPFGVVTHDWNRHPVVLVVDHPEFGMLGLKTEIHNIGDPSPQIIFSTK